MGGWFNKEINSLADLEGLKMRIPGLGGEVLRRAGGTPVNTPGGEIFTALQTGAIDATEWVGPYNDLAIGLHQVAKYYYYPGWHEPGTCLEAIFNKDSFEALPGDLQALVMMACQSVNNDMLAEYTANNQGSLDTLVNTHDVELREFPPDVLQRLRELTVEAIDELAANDDLVRRVWESQKSFGATAARWSDVSERAYFRARSV
jgi:TRAP-type mannitol/chloroaromatic compound transport system substrate-binding protein